jgi:PST family polysaccharide transporter
MVAQMALARLLVPEDWGLVGLAFTVSAFADLLASAGFREVLVQRHKRFGLWAPPAFWLALAFGVLAAAAMAAIAPLAARFYDAPSLPRLIYVLATASPIMSLACVPEANMRMRMRFRPLSLLSSIRNVGITLASVLLAALGAGAMSFVLPRPFFALLYAGGCWVLAPSPISLRLHVRRWRYLLSDSLVVLLAALVLTIIGQAGFVVLGRITNEHVVGHYFFAYNLSLQAAILLGLNLAGVLFPALTALQDEPSRQREAFVRASRMIAVLGLPLCAAQAAVAVPLISIFYGQRMLPAAGIFAVLSVGMGYHVLWNPSRSLMQSGGRFGLSLITLTCYAALFVPAVIVGTQLGGALGAAIATAAVFTIVAPIETWIALRAIGGGAAEVREIYLEPTVLTCLAIGPLALAAWLFSPNHTWALWAQLIGFPLLGAVTYLLLLSWRMPDVLADVRQRISGLARPRASSI